MGYDSKYQKTYQILQELEAGDLQDGLFSCFAVSQRGELVYFDAIGAPFGVTVRGAAIEKTRPLTLPSQPMTVISTDEAFRVATRTNENYRLAQLILSQVRQFQRRGIGLGGYLMLTLGLLASGIGLWYFFLRPSAQAPISVDLRDMKVIATGSYNPIASPSISFKVFRDFLKELNSPAYPEAEAMYRACLTEGCDPALALAFFEKESSGGTAGVAVQTKSIGNIRCTPDYSCYTTQGNGSFRKYENWAESTKDWAKLLKFYRDQRKLSTLEEIIPVYAPASDNNDETGYIAAVKKRVDELRARELK